MLMPRTFTNLFGLIKEKTVPQIEPIFEVTRDGLPKAYIPNFLYKPPFGYPRYVDLPNVRRLASTPFVEMCISTSIDELCSVEWDIVPKDGIIMSKEVQAHIDHVKMFYDNPNTNKESFDEIRKKYIRDIFEIDAGVINKIFNIKGEMVEIVSRDGATFTKNPDIYGMMTDRDEIIIDSYIVQTNKEARLMEPGWINAADARERAAYFQYGWITGARPVPFGKKEIIWLERNPRTDSIYGRSPVEILAETIQTLIYSIEHNLEYFNDNSIPKGIIGLEGLDADGIKAFRDQWVEQQRKKDTAGNWKKIFHHIPIVGTMPKFERIQFSNAELELLEGQKWWAQIVWACFGVTATELGYTEDAKGMANQIVQSNVFKKRVLNPILRLEEYKHNHEILPEFGYDDVMFKFMTFDVEEETKKANLYKLQIDTGIKTVNEIRADEGMEPVSWGDDDPKRNQGNNFNISNGNGNPMGKEANDKKKESELQSRGEEGKSIEAKPGMGHSDKWWEIYHALRREGHSEESAAKIANSKESKSEDKSMSQENPLILRENERPTADKLKRSIIYLMRENEKLVNQIIEREMGQNKLKEIKSVDDLAKSIKKIVTFEGLKFISDIVIKNTFTEGWEKSEKQLNKNLMVNKDVITYIQNYTFNNIKGMTEEIVNDLRAELERGIMQGEGIAKIKDRVKKVFDVGENRAEMIARTETNRAENQGKLKAFESSGVKYKKKWVATLDNRTSHICRRLNGKEVGMEENFDDKDFTGPCPPAHVDCRSSLIFVTKDD
jgi:SPP1 gp7 family putative phage head morphogenesis protein